MLLRLLALSLAFFVIGCSECAPRRAPPSVRPPAPAPSGEWIALDGASLPPATPATEVAVHREAFKVDNRELVATWPEGAVQRARAEVPDRPDWPLVNVTLESPSAEGMSYPALAQVLTDARRAERGASAGGSGAGVFNLRVANDVPFETVERVIYTAALAGYAAPRVIVHTARSEAERGIAIPTGSPPEEIVRSARSDRMLLWPTAPPAIDDVRRPAPRVLASLQSVVFRLDERPIDGCTLAPLTDAALVRCAHRLRAEATSGVPAALEVVPALPFARVVAILVPLAAEFDGVRVVSRAR